MSTKKEMLIDDIKRLSRQIDVKQAEQKKEVKRLIEDKKERYIDDLSKILTVENYANLMSATTWCDQYIYKAIKIQIEKANDKNKKAAELVEKATCARENVDIRMISADLTSREIKDAARLCAKICYQITENDQISKEYGLKELIEKFEKTENQQRIGYAIPKIDYSGMKDDRLYKRLLTEKWWNKKLRQTIERNRAMVFSHIGAVGKGMSKYASIDSIENYKQKLKAQQNYLKTHVVINTLTGETRALKDIASTPEKRFNQMYTMMKGTEKYATEKGLSSAMLTLTVPAKYHCNSKHGKNSWYLSNYSDPKIAQNWLANRWDKVTKRLEKKGIEKLGLRIAEVHTDGTPHWHSVVFFLEKDEDTIKNTIADVWKMTEKRNWVGVSGRYVKKHYPDLYYGEKITKKMVSKKDKEGKWSIKEEDIKRIGNIEHVLRKDSIAANWLKIDTSIASATSYMCKYISKSLLVDMSEKSMFLNSEEKEVKRKEFQQEYNNMLGVNSTRSTFNIRAFQFFGLPKGIVGMWEMYRKQREDQIDNKIDRRRRDAACKGDFCTFITLIQIKTPEVIYKQKINSFGEIVEKEIGYKSENFDGYDLKMTKQIITSKTTFYFKNQYNTYIINEHNFIVIKKDKNLSLQIENLVRVSNNDPSGCAEPTELSEIEQLDALIYDDDPAYW